MISEGIHKLVQMLLKSDDKKGTHKCANAWGKPRQMYKRTFDWRTFIYAIQHVRMSTKLGGRWGSSHYDENHSQQDKAFSGREEWRVPLPHNASGVGGNSFVGWGFAHGFQNCIHVNNVHNIYQARLHRRQDHFLKLYVCPTRPPINLNYYSLEHLELQSKSFDSDYFSNYYCMIRAVKRLQFLWHIL